MGRMVKGRPSKQVMRKRVLLFAIVGVIVLGMFGMHGLTADHSTTAANAPSHTVVATQSMPANALASHSNHLNDSSDSSGHAGMLALCLAVIAGGALLLWAAFVALRRRPIAQLKRAVTTGRTFVQSVFRPPPDLISLSILRC